MSFTDSVGEPVSRQSKSPGGLGRSGDLGMTAAFPKAPPVRPGSALYKPAELDFK
jgi:hypothetical protein